MNAVLVGVWFLLIITTGMVFWVTGDYAPFGIGIIACLVFLSVLVVKRND